MNIPWDDVKLFLAVAETGSLSAAAKRLGVAQPTVSRRLAELEATLGEPLFTRGVEGTAPTEFGERLREPAKHMAEWAAIVERVAEAPAALPTGVVKVTAPPGVAYEFVAPFAAWLAKEQPGLRLEVSSTIKYVDLVRRDADLALRTQKPHQRDLVCLASIEFEARAFASPAYAKKLPPRPRVTDIAWIVWAPPFVDVPPNPQLSRLIPDLVPAFSSDDFLIQLRACEQGLGAMFMGHVQHRFQEKGRLVPLEIDLPKIPASLHLVSARSALTVPRVRVVAELLAKEMERAVTKPTRARE